MKTITLKVPFDEQKRAALAQFLSKKGVALEDEVAAFLQKEYMRAVPAPVREFIENDPKSVS